MFVIYDCFKLIFFLNSKITFNNLFLEYNASQHSNDFLLNFIMYFVNIAAFIMIHNSLQRIDGYVETQILRFNIYMRWLK